MSVTLALLIVHVLPADFAQTGINQWNLDAINVTNRIGADPFASGPGVRPVAYDGNGIYVAVLDSGLVRNWRDLFPEHHIDENLAQSFLTHCDPHSVSHGLQGLPPPGLSSWDEDTLGHGTQVAAVLLGWRWNTPSRFPLPPVVDIQGVSPNVTLIPVRTLCPDNSFSNEDLIAGIHYVTGLVASHQLPVGRVVMNLEGADIEPLPAVLEAVEDAIAEGIVVVSGAGTCGPSIPFNPHNCDDDAGGRYLGLEYPGAYPMLISVGNAGWTHNWRDESGDPTPIGFWSLADVAEPTDPSQIYVSSGSGRENDRAHRYANGDYINQELDLIAPGSYIWLPAPPAQEWGPGWTGSTPNRGKFVGGSSFSLPHVAGAAALLLQRRPGLNQAVTEAILRCTALPIQASDGEQGFLDFDFVTGAVIPNHTAWDAAAAGHGLLQVDRALACLSLDGSFPCLANCP